MYIGGAQVEGEAVIDRENPSRPNRPAGSVFAASASQANHAVDVAHSAFGRWSRYTPEDRATLLRVCADAIRHQADELGFTLATELGKPLAASIGEARFAALYLDLVADRAPDLHADVEITNRFGTSTVIKRPYGVVSAIVPWNAPLILAMLKIAPALATGNTMVLKPSPLSPLALTAMVGVIADNLPAGVLNVVNGGADVGAALTTHDAIRKVAFTGGLPTARSVMRAAADGVKPVVLELGGNDPAIVVDVANLSDNDVSTLVQATFGTSGQVCIAVKRIYVPHHQVMLFADRFRASARESLVLGDALDPTTTMGPVVTQPHADHITALVEDAAAMGATVSRLGHDGDRAADGYFVEPTLITGATPEMAVVVEEQFGPTVPVLGYDTIDEAVAQANDSDLGLAASVWTDDRDEALAIARRLEVGTTFVNSHNRFGVNPGAPFGGTKLSGFGREYGDAGIEAYLQIHAINTPASRIAEGYPDGKDST